MGCYVLKESVLIICIYSKMQSMVQGPWFWHTFNNHTTWHSCAVAGIFTERKVCTMVADALAPCVASSSTAMLLCRINRSLPSKRKYHIRAIQQVNGKTPWWRHQMETLPRYWPFVRGIHRSPVDSPQKGQWRGALMFSLICARTNGWANNRDAGNLRRPCAYYDVCMLSFFAEHYRRIYILHRSLAWTQCRQLRKNCISCMVGFA